MIEHIRKKEVETKLREWNNYCDIWEYNKFEYDKLSKKCIRVEKKLDKIEKLYKKGNGLSYQDIGMMTEHILKKEENNEI